MLNPRLVAEAALCLKNRARRTASADRVYTRASSPTSAILKVSTPRLSGSSRPPSREHGWTLRNVALDEPPKTKAPDDPGAFCVSANLPRQSQRSAN